MGSTLGERKGKKYWMRKNIRLHMISPRGLLELFCIVMRELNLDSLLNASCSLEGDVILRLAVQGNLQKGPRAEVCQLVVLPKAIGINTSVLMEDSGLTEQHPL